MNEDPNKCSNCGEGRLCLPFSKCWCMAYPAVLPVEEGASCLCSACLDTAVKQKIDELVNSDSKKEIAALGPVTKPMQGIDYHINEDGNLVFSKWYHLRRGSCCGSGCLHCPYGDQEKKLV